MIAKPISINGAERKSGGRVQTADELIAGDLRRVSTAGLTAVRTAVTALQESAEGIVGERRRPERGKGQDGLVISCAPSGRISS
jgi:hypothetical protein